MHKSKQKITKNEPNSLKIIEAVDHLVNLTHVSICFGFLPSFGDVYF